MRLITAPKNNILLLIIIVVGSLFLRIWGVEHSLPFVGGEIPDEPYFADQGITILRNGLLDFSGWRIGQLYPYMLAGFSKPLFIIYGVDPHQLPTYRELADYSGINCCIGIPYPFPEYYLWGRIVMAIMGSLCIIFVYLIGKELKSKTLGLISAYFVAVFPLQVTFSQNMLRTIPGLLFLLLAFYVILLAYSRDSWLLYLLSGFLTGVAIYTKQNNFILLAPLGLAIALSIYYSLKKYSLKDGFRIVALFAIALVVVLAIDWMFNLLNIRELIQTIYGRIFSNPFFYGGYQFGRGENGLQWAYNVFLNMHWRYIIFLAVPGVFVALFLKKQKGWLLLSVPIPYLIMTNFFTVFYAHWLIPPFTFLAISAALFLETMYLKTIHLTRWKSSYVKAVLITVILAVSIPSIYQISVQDYENTQESVSNIASRWLQDNLPEGTTIVIDRNGPYVSPAQHNPIYVRSIFNKDLHEYKIEGIDYIVGNEISLIALQSARSDHKVREDVEKQLLRANIIITQLPVEKSFVGAGDLEIRLYKVP